MKTYRITMILVALTWTAAAMTTPIDSLYRRICSTPRADIGEVNRLLMLLDADGITDSLIQHDRHAPREGMMAATHLYMADYFYTLAPIENGPYYAGQMALAAKLLDIIIDEGGKNDYADTESEDPADWCRPEDFIPYVNMKNAKRFKQPHNVISFFCEAQELRFRKAWHLFMRILNEKMFDHWCD